MASNHQPKREREMENQERDEMIDLHYRRNAKQLISFSARSCGGWHNAQDAVQTAYERAVRYWGSYREDSSFDTWIKPIVRNAIIDIMVDVRARGGTTAEVEHYPQPVWGDIATDAMERMRDKPDNVRNILKLHFIGNYNVLEVTEMVTESRRQVRNEVDAFKTEMSATLDT